MARVMIILPEEIGAAEDVIREHLQVTLAQIPALQDEPLQERWLFADAVRGMLAHPPLDCTPLVRAYWNTDKSKTSSIHAADRLLADLEALTTLIESRTKGDLARRVRSDDGVGVNTRAVVYVAMRYWAGWLEGRK